MTGRRPSYPVDAVTWMVGQRPIEATAALAEVARVLRPGGRLGLIWNFRDDSQPWMRELSAIAGQDGLPQGWWRAFAALPEIESIERRDFQLEHRLDRDGLLALVGSWSTVASQDEARRQSLLRQIEELWDHHPQLRGSARASLTYRTETYCLRLGP